MGRFARELSLRYDANRTRHAYYRQLRLVHEHFEVDPVLVTQAQLRDDSRGWQLDPEVWGKEWGVHVQPAGNGGAALRYLGAYVARTAIRDARMVRVDDATVTFRWKNREAANRQETCTLPGVEFVARYLRHVLPRGLRSIRYYGFCHPAARVKRMRVQCHAGGRVEMGAPTPVFAPPAPIPLCSCCRRPMRLVNLFPPP